MDTIDRASSYVRNILSPSSSLPLLNITLQLDLFAIAELVVPITDCWIGPVCLWRSASLGYYPFWQPAIYFMFLSLLWCLTVLFGKSSVVDDDGGGGGGAGGGAKEAEVVGSSSEGVGPAVVA